MRRSNYIVAGLGNIGLELVKRMSKDVEVTCIDLDPETERKVKDVREDALFVHGDATSRLVLEKGGVAEADAVIVTIPDEKVSIETARLVKEHFETKRILAIAATQAGVEALEELGAEVENIFASSAISIRNKLEQTSRSAHAIGLGKDEILEVEVHPNSRLANRPLRTLTPVRWRIGIIYRDENIVVPKRDTVLKPKDKVVILGDPPVLKTVAEIFSFKFQQFPLEYGSTAIACLTGDEDESFFSELDYLFSVFSLNRMVYILSRKAAGKQQEIQQYMTKENIRNAEVITKDLPPFQAIKEALKEVRGDQGLIVMPKFHARKTFLRRTGIAEKKRMLYSLISMAHCPVLLTGGSFPYEKVVIPAVEQVNLQFALETAMEISQSLNNEVTVLVVNPSKYISSDDDIHSFEFMKKTINDVSSMYKISIDKKTLSGNPVKSISQALPEYNLFIADARKWKEQGWLMSALNPDVLWHIIREAGISTLLLPLMEEYL